MTSTRYLLAIAFSTIIWITAARINPETFLNVAAVQGHNVTLRVRVEKQTHETAEWKRCSPMGCNTVHHCRKLDSARYHASISNHTLTEHISHVQDYQLTILRAVLGDAGMYTLHNYQITSSAELIILESDPKCSRNSDVAFEGDVVVMSCQVRYQGRWAPLMVWHEDGVKINATMEKTVAGARHLSGLIKYSLVVVAHGALNATVYSVNTHFTPIQVYNDWDGDPDSDNYEYYWYWLSEYHAENTPAYTHNHRFRPLIVKPSENTTETKQVDNNDSAVILAASVPTVLLLICSIVLGFSLWICMKYRRLGKQPHTYNIHHC